MSWTSTSLTSTIRDTAKLTFHARPWHGLQLITNELQVLCPTRLTQWHKPMTFLRLMIFQIIRPQLATLKACIAHRTRVALMTVNTRMRTEARQSNSNQLVNDRIQDSLKRTMSHHPHQDIPLTTLLTSHQRHQIRFLQQRHPHRLRIST